MENIVKLENQVQAYKLAIMGGNVSLADYLMPGIIYMVKEIVPTLDDLEARQVATMLVMMA